MFDMHNTMKVISRLPGGISGRTLADFSDSGEVAEWAKEAMTHLDGAGMINGSHGKLLPADTTTRAKIAQVLYNLLISKYPRQSIRDGASAPPHICDCDLLL
jgi:hypothetical protein